MEINIYQDFLSPEEIYHITGRKRLSGIIEQLNAMGIPFKQNAHGKPIIRRDYAAPKRAPKPLPQENDVYIWGSNASPIVR